MPASPSQYRVVLMYFWEGRQRVSNSVRFKAQLELYLLMHAVCSAVPLQDSVHNEDEYKFVKLLHLLPQAGPRLNESVGFRSFTMEACCVAQRSAVVDVRLHVEVAHDKRVSGSRPTRHVLLG